MAMPAPDIIAIDILLEPDARMLAAAEEHNARLRAEFPDSFALDSEHRPHITLLQCFISARDLDKLSDAVGAVIKSAGLNAMVLQAHRYGYTPGPGMGVAGIWVTVTPDLSKLQTDIIAAAAPFMLATAGIEAFTTGHGNPAYDAALISYVAGFVEKAGGANFDPHISTGVGATAYLDAMMSEPFTPFAFAPAGAAIYQLGPFGTAAKPLKLLKTAG
jgi:hypothetical protein